MRGAATILAMTILGCGGAGNAPDEDAAPGDDGKDDDPTDGGDAGPGPGIWHPAPGTSWQWQLTGAIDTSFDVAMYDLDLDAVGAVIDELHAAGRIVICYFSAGSVEYWRDDIGGLPAAAIGNALDGWPDEHWLDVRHPAVRALAAGRIERAAALGCDGVEPDNVDGYDNDPGFAFDAADQLDFNRFLAAEAHARGLSIGLKNDLAQIGELLADFDWALNEECFAYAECADLDPFIAAGKAVFHVEYAGDRDAICAESAARGFSTLLKDDDVGPVHVTCN
jgi:hypothetical protein